jgi:hypothetical protein
MHAAHQRVSTLNVLIVHTHRIKDVVCDFYGVDMDKLQTSKRGVFNEPKAIAI